VLAVYGMRSSASSAACRWCSPSATAASATSHLVLSGH
jgi:hypothetical protein